MRLLLKWVIAAGSIILVSYYVPGIHVSGFYSALIAALVLGALSVTIKPVFKLIAFPITLITLGLFSFVINALLFWFAGTVVNGFAVDGFVPALIGSVIVSVINYAGDKVFSKEED